MKLLFYLLLILFNPFSTTAQNSAYTVLFGYGTTNQLNTWINDVYLGLNVYEIRPESRNQMSLYVNRNFHLRNNILQAGIGLRKEYFTTDERYQNMQSTSAKNYYSGIITVSIIKPYKVQEHLSLFWSAGVNFQLHNIFYKDGFLISGGKSTHVSQVNGNVVKDEEIEVYLYQKSPIKIIPQANLGVGFFSLINSKSSLSTTIALEYDLLKSSYLAYQFNMNDKLNNIQYSYAMDSRAMKRIYFSIRVGYNFNL